MAEQPSITCPVCGDISYNENDIREGYCRFCHKRTSGKRPVVYTLLPVEPTNIPAESRTEAEWAYQSPSRYWTIVYVAPVHQTGRMSSTLYKMLLIRFSHTEPNGDTIIVEVYVDSKEKLQRMGPFLDASVDLPTGVRIRAHTLEAAPWDEVHRQSVSR